MSKARGLINKPWAEWCYYKSGFHKYGLMRDDCRKETPEVVEAIRRCPQHLIDARNFRIIRAMQVNQSHSILPENQWTKFEEDILYLKPYIEEVEKEIAEKKAWDAE